MQQQVNSRQSNTCSFLVSRASTELDMDGVQGTDVSDAIVIRFLKKKKKHLQKYNAKFFSKGLLK